MEGVNDFWSNLKFRFIFLIYFQSFVLLLELTVSLKFWPLKKKTTNKKKTALAVGGDNCLLEIEAKHRMVGK